MIKNRKLLSIGASAAVLSGVLVGGISLIDRGPTVANAASGFVSQVSPTTPPTAADRAAAKEAYLQSLATNLGVTVDSLKAALTKTNLAQLDKAVADAKITQAEADAMRTNIAAGNGPLTLVDVHRGGHGGDKGRGGVHVDRAALLTFLGIDETAYNTARQAQKSLATIAQEAGKSRDQLKAFLTDQAKTHLAAEVASGKITQAQADEKLAAQTANLDAMIDGAGPVGGGRGPKPTNP